MDDYDQPPMPGFAPPINLHSSNILQLTDSTEELRDFEMKLRGLKNENGILKAVSPPLMNDEGINYSIGFLKTIVTRITKLVDIQDAEKDQVMEFIINSLNRDFLRHRKDFGIKDTVTKNTICTEMELLCYFTILRGREGSDKRFFKGSVMELKSEFISPQKKSIAGMLNPMDMMNKLKDQ